LSPTRLSRAEESPIRLLKTLAAAGPVSLVEVDDIECSCVLLGAQLDHAEAPFGMPHRQGTLVKPMTVWGLMPAGVNLALSKTALRGDEAESALGAGELRCAIEA